MQVKTSMFIKDIFLFELKIVQGMFDSDYIRDPRTSVSYHWVILSVGLYLDSALDEKSSAISQILNKHQTHKHCPSPGPCNTSTISFFWEMGKRKLDRTRMSTVPTATEQNIGRATMVSGPQGLQLDNSCPLLWVSMTSTELSQVCVCLLPWPTTSIQKLLVLPLMK